MRTYYDLLNLGKDADKKDIKRAFHALAKRLHPDVYRTVSSGGASSDMYRTVSSGGASSDVYRKKSSGGESFLEVLTAYETLIDDRKREAYNTMLQTLEKDLAKGRCPNVYLPKSRVSFALSLKDIASLRVPSRAGNHRRRGFANPKGYHVCVDLTETELAGSPLVEIDVPAHVVCPVCRGDRVHCAFCSSKGQVLRAVPVAVPIPGHLTHGEVFALPLRAQRGKGDVSTKGYAFFMIDTLFVKVRIFEDADR
jgi:DnaJ-class molecular chaperone